MTTLEKFSEEIQGEIKKIVTQLDLQNGELAALGGAITSVRQLLFRLREFVVTYHFAESTEEIRFFKEIKPVMMSQYIYHKHVLDIRLRCSILPREDRLRCVQRALRKCHLYTMRHQEFYRYCLSGATHLDSQYFIRSAQALNRVESDPMFTTAFDPILSRLVATQLLSEFVTQWITTLHTEPASSVSGLKWTASKTDLTELIYALQASEVFNNGSADIKQIATAFESMTGIKLGDYYRTFQAIQVRKNNQVAFMARLKERLQAKLDDIE